MGGYKIGAGDPWLIFDEAVLVASSKGAQGALDAFTFGLLHDDLARASAQS